MHTTRQGCKVYYVVHVKRILPLNCETGVENRAISSIIRLLVLVTNFPVRLEPGGIYAHTYTVRPKMRQPAPARYSESTSRASKRFIFPGAPFFRSPRSAPGQIRDAAPGCHRWATRWNHGCCVWFLAYEVIPTSQTLRDKWFIGANASNQGASPGSQTIRRYSGLYPANIESRARYAHYRLAAACEPTVWNIHPSAQYRKSTGKTTKKNLPHHEMPNPLDKTADRSASECLSQYEILRRQALEPGDDANPNGLELAFIERQGLAAWIDAGWNSPSSVNTLEGLQITTIHGPEKSSVDLVLALADLVLGDRQEKYYD